MAERSDISARTDPQAARLDGDQETSVFEQLAEAHRREGLLDEAIRICRVGLQAQPYAVSGRVALGRALFDKGALEEAEAEFERVLELAPGNVQALLFLGDVFTRRGQSAEARARYKRLLRLQPLHGEAQARLAALDAGGGAGASPPGGFPADTAAPGDRSNVDPLATQTLAALYASQGHVAEAAAIYAQLGRPSGQEPADPSAGARPMAVGPTRVTLERLLLFREWARRAREARRR